jgi:pimeloyl-ACP methyl ester carboxylesterase
MQRYDPSLPRPEALAVPVLVLHGTADRNTPYAIAEDLSRSIPGAALVTVAEGSHMLPATHPDELAEAIHGFVSRGGS